MGMDTGMGMDMDMDMGFVRDSDYYVDLERNGTAIVCIVTHVPLPNPEPDRLSPPLRYLFTDQAYDKVTLGAKCAKGDSVEMANSFQKQLRKVGG